MAYEYQKYLCTKETLKETINKYGVAIIPNVLNENECESIVNGLWSYFEHITQKWEKPIDRANRDTWREFYKLYPLHSMLVQYWGAGQTQISWDIRQNPKIISIFAHLWNCDPNDLLVSFDGLSFNLPPEITNKGWFMKPKYHTDQSPTKIGFQCVQSWVTGLDVNENDATFAFLEKSNQHHEAFGKHFNILKLDDWYLLNSDEIKYFENLGCSHKRIKCPKGSMVFWDSRTIHFGAEALKNRSVPNLRAIIYLCYMPRKLCDSTNLRKKIKAFEEMRTTNHYPCKIKMFPKMPMSYGGKVYKITPISKPVLNETGKRLAGLI